MHTRNLLFIAIGLLVTVTLFGQDSLQNPEEEALHSARSWLAMIDQGNYAESWEESADLVKNAVTRDDWIQSMKGARIMFGGLVTRSLKSTEYATMLPGAPDGHYVVIQFETSFEKKESAIETVTPMLDSDGHWRVSGYRIK